MSNWQSLAGYLQMKDNSGGFSALWPRRRYYFVLDEGLKALLYFKTESDFNDRREPVGRVQLAGGTVTTREDLRSHFIVRCANRQQFEFEADNEMSAMVWTAKFQGILGHKNSVTNGLQDSHPSWNSYGKPPESPGLPTDSEMAELLDNALKSSLQHRASVTSNKMTSPLSQPQMKDGRIFYFPSSPDGPEDPDTETEAARTPNPSGGAAGEQQLQKVLRNWILDAKKSDKQSTESLSESRKKTPQSGSLGIDALLAVQQLSREFDSGKPMSPHPMPKHKVIQTMENLLTEMEQQKRDYVSLLQSCVTIPLSENRPNMVDVRLYGGDRHKIRVSKLIAEARLSDPTLPTFESLAGGSAHMDVYGFQHTFSTEGLILHYLCTQLNLHYQQGQQQQNKELWKSYLKASQGIITNNRDTRKLIRQGIPSAYRSMIWRRLIHQHVADIKASVGKYYYKNLVSQHSAGQSEVQAGARCHKQISLDLLRTMPNNIHFCSPNCKGISQMQEVLTAFCQHKPDLGYCQGMNFIVATALLFLNTEDAFWLLVAMTEKYFVPSYFDSALSGAQADQEVLKELVDLKLPELSDHLQRCDIELATITLNWFLAIFFDCLPFETMLRVWDIFLLEGPKVLFRFALGLLQMHKEALMERSDTISIMKILKAASKYTYDSDGLVKIAFIDLKPFPKRKMLIRKQTAYLRALKQRLRIKEELKNELTRPDSTRPRSRQFSIHLSASIAEDHVLVAFGNQDSGRLASVDVRRSTMLSLGIEFNCKVLAVAVAPNALYISLLSSVLVAFNTAENVKLWEIQLRDVALALEIYEGALFCGLTNGSLAVIEKISTKQLPTVGDMFYIPLGPAPISCMCVSNEQLWCSIASKAIVLNLKTLDAIEEVYLAANVTGGAVSFFERVQTLVPCHAFGVWVILQKSSLVQLWDTSTFTAVLLYDVSNDHFNVTYKDEENIHISCLLSYDNSVWVGTTDGYLMIYEVRRKHGSTSVSGPHSRRHTNRSMSLSKSGSLDTSSRSSLLSSNLSVFTNRKGSVNPPTMAMRDSAYESLKMSPVSIQVDIPDKIGSPTRKQARTLEPSHDELVRNIAKHSPEGQAFRAPLSVSKEDLVRINSPDIAAPSSIQKSYSICPAAMQQNMEAAAAALQNYQDNNMTDGSDSRFERVRRMSESSRKNSISFLRAQSTFNLADMESDVSTEGPPTDRSLRSYASMSSVHTSATGSGYEFDDYLGTYYDEASPKTSQHAGGLISYQLSRTNSGWSLQSEPLSASLLNLANGAERGKRKALHDNEREEVEDVQLKRRDLDVEQFLLPPSRHEDYETDSESRLSHFAASDNASVISVGSFVEPPFLFELSLQMMLKISDKPVSSLNVSKRHDNTDCIISCSGSYGDEEAILRWVREPDQKLWTNDPVIDEGELANQLAKSPYSRVRLPRTV